MNEKAQKGQICKNGPNDTFFVAVCKSCRSDNLEVEVNGRLMVRCKGCNKRFPMEDIDNYVRWEKR